MGVTGAGHHTHLYRVRRGIFGGADLLDRASQWLHLRPLVRLPARLVGELGVLGAQAVQRLLVQILQVQQRFARSLGAGDQLVQLDLQRSRIAILAVLMRNTIRKVMMVVEVLMMSCQVSL